MSKIDAGRLILSYIEGLHTTQEESRAVFKLAFALKGKTVEEVLAAVEDVKEDKSQLWKDELGRILQTIKEANSLRSDYKCVTTGEIFRRSGITDEYNRLCKVMEHERRI